MLRLLARAVLQWRQLVRLRLDRWAARASYIFLLLRALLCDSRGAVAVEFAVILPVQLLLGMGGLELARAMLAEQQLTFVTESAARCAALKGPSCLSAATTGEWAAEQVGSLPGISPSNFQVTFDAPCGGVEVIASYSFSNSVLPPIPLAANACYPTAS